MKKTAYILGSLEIIIGILLLCVSTIIRNIMPALGRVAYQAAAAGSYSPGDYTVSMPLLIASGIFLIVIGAAQQFFCFFRKNGVAE